MDDGGDNGTSSLRVEVRADAAKLANPVIAGFGNRRNLVGKRCTCGRVGSQSGVSIFTKFFYVYTQP